MEEIIVDALTPEDFVLLEKILKRFTISIDSDISYQEVVDLHSKVTDIINIICE